MKKQLMAASILLFGTVIAHAQDGQPGAHFIENWDMNEDGSVSFAEAEERRIDIFLSFDANDDGALDADEYREFDAARDADMEGQKGHGAGRMRRVAEGMTLAFNDVDGNGQVTRDEFVGKTAEWFAMIDRDGSQLVTVSDFGPRQ